MNNTLTKVLVIVIVFVFTGSCKNINSKGRSQEKGSNERQKEFDFYYPDYADQGLTKKTPRQIFLDSIVELSYRHYSAAIFYDVTYRKSKSADSAYKYASMAYKEDNRGVDLMLILNDLRYGDSSSFEPAKWYSVNSVMDSVNYLDVMFEHYGRFGDTIKVLEYMKIADTLSRKQLELDSCYFFYEYLNLLIKIRSTMYDKEEMLKTIEPYLTNLDSSDRSYFIDEVPKKRIPLDSRPYFDSLRVEFGYIHD